MHEEKVTLKLDRYECGMVFHSLKDKRNQLLETNQDTELVEDVLMMVVVGLELLPEKDRKGRGLREER